MTEIKLCKSCGAPLSPTANFCRECGTPVLKPASVVESVSTAPVEKAAAETAAEPSTANELVNDGVALYEKGDYNGCLLYTSDAADDLTRVDLGGRRIIKKKNQ